MDLWFTQRPCFVGEGLLVGADTVTSHGDRSLRIIQLSRPSGVSRISTKGHVAGSRLLSGCFLLQEHEVDHEAGHASEAAPSGPPERSINGNEEPRDAADAARCTCCCPQHETAGMPSSSCRIFISPCVSAVCFCNQKYPIDWKMDFLTRLKSAPVPDTESLHAGWLCWSRQSTGAVDSRMAMPMALQMEMLSIRWTWRCANCAPKNSVIFAV